MKRLHSTTANHSINYSLNMWNSFPACPLDEIHYQPDTLRITWDMNFVPSLLVNDVTIFERSIFGPQHCALSKQQSVISRRNHNLSFICKKI